MSKTYDRAEPDMPWLQAETIQHLRDQAARDCSGKGSTHYPGCPCSVLRMIEDMQAELNELRLYKICLSQGLRGARTAFNQTGTVDDIRRGVDNFNAAMALLRKENPDGKD